MEKSYLILAEGFEEIEALATVDILRRAGIDIVTVSITGDYVVAGAHNIQIAADQLWGEDDDINRAQWLIIPGGMPGASNCAAFEPLNKLLTERESKGEGIAAICAAPAVVLAPLEILKGKKATCYPGFENELEKWGAEYTQAKVENVDNRIITANGPAQAMDFALAIVAATKGDGFAKDVADGLLKS